MRLFERGKRLRVCVRARLGAETRLTMRDANLQFERMGKKGGDGFDRNRGSVRFGGARAHHVERSLRESPAAVVIGLDSSRNSTFSTACEPHENDLVRFPFYL